MIKISILHCNITPRGLQTDCTKPLTKLRNGGN